MKRTSIIIAVSSALLFAVACKKDLPDFDNTYPGSTSSTGALTAALQQNGPQSYSVTFNAAIGASFRGYAGTKVFIPANAFVYGNQPVTGNVTVTIIEAYSKKDIICTGGFTTASGLPLVSGGEIFIQATQNNQVLEYNQAAQPMRVLFPTNNASAEMELFVADAIRAEDDFDMIEGSLWISTDCTLVPGPPGPPPPPPPYYYEVFTLSLGWINCDYFMSTPGPLSAFTISVPPMFNSANSMVFITYDDYNNATTVYNYDPATHVFHSGTYYKLPVGMDVKFIIVSEINGQLYWGEQAATIEEDHVTSLIPMPVTQAEFDQKLQSLQ
jgi:hypothetical protein